MIRGPGYRRVLLPLASVLLLQALAVAIVALAPFPLHLGAEWADGVLFGLTFGTVTVMGAWSAAGPGPVALRIPASALGVTVAAAGLIWSMDGWGPTPDALVTIFGAAMTQWLALQLAVWLARGAFKSRLVHSEDHEPRSAQQQFAIRDLLILTTVVACALAICRGLLVLVQSQAWIRVEIVIAYGMLAAANSLITLPFLVGTFLMRRWLVALFGGLIYAAILTWLEWSAFVAVLGRGAGGPIDVFIWINAIQVAWVTFTLWIVRAAGYRFVAVHRGLRH